MYCISLSVVSRLAGRKTVTHRFPRELEKQTCGTVMLGYGSKNTAQSSYCAGASRVVGRRIECSPLAFLSHQEAGRFEIGRQHTAGLSAS